MFEPDWEDRRDVGGAAARLPAQQGVPQAGLAGPLPAQQDQPPGEETVLHTWPPQNVSLGLVGTDVTNYPGLQGVLPACVGGAGGAVVPGLGSGPAQPAGGGDEGEQERGQAAHPSPAKQDRTASQLLLLLLLSFARRCSQPDPSPT